MALILAPLSRWRQKHPMWFAHHQWESDESEDKAEVERATEGVAKGQAKDKGWKGAATSLVRGVGVQAERAIMWLVS